MLRNAKGRWCAPKSRKKHHGDASVKLHDAVTRLKLDTCPAFDIGGENHDFYILAVYTVQPVQRNDFFVEPEWIGSLGSPNLSSAAGLPGRIQNPT